MSTAPNSETVVRPHPWPELVEAIRPQTDEETARLAESLATHGQQHAVLIWRDGRIIDGYHRWQVLGDDAKVQMLAELSEEEALALGITLNVARRQMTNVQLRKVDEHYRAAILRLREAGASQTKVAETLGLSQSTVSAEERKARATRDASPDTPGQTLATDLRVTTTPAQKRKALKAIADGKSQRKAAELAGVSLSSVQRWVREKAEGEAREAEGVTLKGPATLAVEVADRPRETGRRLHEALMGARADVAMVASFALRCAIEEADSVDVVTKALRKALTPTQMAALAVQLAPQTTAPEADATEA